MLIYPAIDLKDGKCVRLLQGKFDDMTVYSDNPVEMAYKWEDMGAEYLHLVDLDGARSGVSRNIDIISSITAAVRMPVQMGGGIRSMEMIEKILDSGVQRAILGTSAVRQPELVKDALARYGERIVIGIDARNGQVAIEGWEQTSAFNAIDFAMKMEDMGAKTIIYTDISRDGMLYGPNLDEMVKMADAVDIDIIASGGVGCLEDISNLKKTGVSGVIIGKALYTGRIDLKEALKVAAE
ncbi:MAG: 1-(5-phosphoribosyl)-5-[(5-phosphoribosylamino)methylideneamino]imidazole-4-carboxamide isomerase [Acetivibrionales bacterium]